MIESDIFVQNYDAAAHAVWPKTVTVDNNNL